VRRLPDGRLGLPLLGIPAGGGKRARHIGPAWDKAFAADRPVVIDCVCDPTIPTLPPKITAKQRNNYFKTLLKGDPDEAAIIKNALKRAFTS
jgi:pyruvate dehydrogenase (quinone)